jgi:hypothetical protein
VAQGVEPRVIHASSVAVTRKHRRAKTDRLDTDLLKRAFLGWLRGERGHCKMVAVPTLAEEDAKRPSRERETLVAEATRLMARLKAAFARLGIRSFNPKLKAAPERLGALRTPSGKPIPGNTLAALQRDMARHRFVKARIREIETERLARLKAAPAAGTNPMVRLLARVVASASRRPIGGPLSPPARQAEAFSIGGTGWSGCREKASCLWPVPLTRPPTIKERSHGADHDTEVFLDCGVNANPTAQRMGRLSAPCPAPVLSRPGVAASERRASVAVTGFWRPRERLLGRPLTVEISHASVRCKDGRPCGRRQRPKQPLRGDHE